MNGNIYIRVFSIFLNMDVPQIKPRAILISFDKFDDTAVSIVQKTPKPRLLWASRHVPLQIQREVLYEKGIRTIVQFSMKFENAEQIVEIARKCECEYVVPVLPLSMIARLVELAPKYGITVLWAEMEQIKVLKTEPKAGVDYDPNIETYVASPEGYKIMRFKKFWKLIKVELVKEEV